MGTYQNEHSGLALTSLQQLLPQLFLSWELCIENFYVELAAHQYRHPPNSVGVSRFLLYGDLVAPEVSAVLSAVWAHPALATFAC